MRTPLTVLLVLFGSALAASEAPVHTGTRIVVELAGVEDDLATNVLANLDLVQFADRDDLSALAVRRMFDHAPEQVRLALRPFGFYEPHTEGTLERDGERFVARLEIDPREPVRLDEVNVGVIGPGEGHPRFERVLAQSALIPGAPLRHRVYDELRGELESVARSLGYFDHRFVRSTIEVLPEARTADIHLILDTEERHHFGAVHFEQDIIEPGLVERLVSADEGDPYDADLLVATQYALAGSEYFANVVVQAGARDPQARTVPILIEAEPAPRQHFSYGGGYGTDTGLRLRGLWEVNRVNRRGHQSELDLRVSEPITEAVAHYVVPVGNPLTDRLAARGTYVDEDLAAAGSRRNAIGVVHQRLVGEWQRNLFLDLVDERTLLPERVTLRDTLVVPGIAIERLHFDDPVLPSKGHRLYAEIRGSHRALGAPTHFARGQAGATMLLSLDEEATWTVLLRGELGLGWVDDFDQLPASQRFFAGGDESVRGYRYRELGSPDTDGYTLGGRHLLTASAEVRRRVIGRWVEVATFVDVGNAVRHLSDGVEASVGIGVHLMTPLGRLRIEAARAVTEGRQVRFHVSIRPDL